MNTTTERPVSDKQKAFIEKLLAEKNTAGTFYEGWVPDWSQATSKAASAVIDYLLTLPRKTLEEAPSEEPEAGVYSWGGTLYRVYLGQQSGVMLVKKISAEYTGTRCYCSDLQGVLCGACRGDVEPRRVSDVSYEYLGRATKHLPGEAKRLSLEEVGSFGIAWNHCLICGRRLDDPESVDRGIGPICASKY